MRVIVIGAGIIGAAVSEALVARGVAVTVVERARPGAGTSGATFAWVNAADKSPPEYLALNIAGMAEWDALERRLGGAWLHRGGNLEWAVDADEVRAITARVDGAAGGGYRARWIDRREAAQLEPDLALGDGADALAFFPDDLWVDVAPLVGHLLGAARDGGARLMTGTDVTALARAADRVSGIVTASGETLEADLVVACTGPDGAALAALAGGALPLKRSEGLIVVTAPAPLRLGRVVHAPGVALRPDGGGRVMVTTSEADRRVAAEPDARLDEAAAAVRAAATVAPALAGVEVETARIGRRALTMDGRPAIGPLAGTVGLYHVVTHSGVTLGPLVGRLVAEEIVSGSPVAALEPYRPDRFGRP